jgi:maltokinase
VIDPGPLAAALADHLLRQRWFDGGEQPAELRSVSQEAITEGWPALVHVIVETRTGRWQLVLALRPAGQWPAALEGKPEAVLGELETEQGRALVYDALVDADVGLALLARVAPDVSAERARPLLGMEQSNSSVIFDEAVILKLYRRLLDGPNPDAEVTRALAAAGFDNVAEPLGEWRMHGMDLAVVNRFVSNGTDGFHLALTSLRDLYGARGEPGEAGGDFAPDARRLGIITARMHVAMAAAFGVGPATPAAWADEAEGSLHGVDLGDVDVGAVRRAFEALRRLEDAGSSVRTHGDYHLGQVLRTDAGWFVLDFEGEPLRPLEVRRRPTSPLRDVAGMVRSLHYAAAVALRQWNDDSDEEVVHLADAWERHNAFAFLEGYVAVEGIDELLPEDEDDRTIVRRAFELEKAVYEVRYERAHRPEWVAIPLAAVGQLVAPT